MRKGVFRSIRAKLLGGFLGSVGIFAVCGIFIFTQVKGIGERSEAFVGEYWPTADLLMEIQIDLAAIGKVIYDPPPGLDREVFLENSLQTLKDFRAEMSATRLPSADVRKAVALLDGASASMAAPLRLHGEPARRMLVADEAGESLLVLIEEIGDVRLANRLWGAIMAFNDVLITGDPEELARFEEIISGIEKHPQFPRLKELYVPFIAEAKGVFEAAFQLKGARDAFFGICDELSEVLQGMEENYARTVVDPSAGEISEKVQMVILSVSGAILVGAVFSLLIGVLLARSLTRPLSRVVSMLESLGRGHLQGRLNLRRQDELGVMARSLDEFADSLQGEVVVPLRKLAQGDISFIAVPRDGGDELRGSLKTLSEDLNRLVGGIQLVGEQIASGAAQVSDASQALSQGATESAGSLEEISASLNELASQTRLNAENAGQANALSAEARQSAESGNRQMQEMVTAMAEINSAGQSIAKIIKSIDEIAFQTNLLALNAAVEAARAGQYGKGFAVVAEEVRTLAARSAKAAKETAELIESAVEKAARGAGIADRTAASLERIVGDVSRVSDLVSEIAVASREQAEGISQINQGLGQIEQVTQQNTASAEECAAASEELSSQAEQLRQMLGRFTLRRSLPEPSKNLLSWS